MIRPRVHHERFSGAGYEAAGAELFQHHAAQVRSFIDVARDKATGATEADRIALRALLDQVSADCPFVGRALFMEAANHNVLDPKTFTVDQEAAVGTIMRGPLVADMHDYMVREYPNASGSTELGLVIVSILATADEDRIPDVKVILTPVAGSTIRPIGPLENPTS